MMQVGFQNSNSSQLDLLTIEAGNQLYCTPTKSISYVIGEKVALPILKKFGMHVSMHQRTEHHYPTPGPVASLTTSFKAHTSLISQILE